MFNEGLYVEKEGYYITILYYIVLSFSSHFTNFLGAGFTVVFDVVIKCNCLCSDEASFKIGVNFTCCFRSCCTYWNGPRSDFLFAGSKECVKIQ